jgi:hypothetical protein
MNVEGDVVRFIEPEVREYNSIYYWTFLVTDNELVAYRSSIFAEAFSGHWGMLIFSAIRRSRASNKLGKTPSDIITSGWKFVLPRTQGQIQFKTERKGLGKSFVVLHLHERVEIDITNENIMSRLKAHCPEIELIPI